MSIITRRRSLVSSGGTIPLSVGGVRPVIWIDISAGDFALHEPPPPPNQVNTAFNRAGTNNASDAGPQGDSGKQPTVGTANSLDAMKFDGGDELPITYTYGSEATWFIVCEDQGLSEYVISGQSSASHPSFLVGFGADFQFSMQGFIPAVPDYSRVLAATGTASVGLHVCAVSHKDGGASTGEIKGYFDGVEEWNDPGPAGVTLAGNKFFTMGGTTISPLYTGRTPSLLIYPKSLTTADMLKVSLFLKNQWGTP